MYSLQEIDSRIDKLLILLEQYQHPVEGFKTLVTQPQLEGKYVWVEEMNNVFVPANIMLPLTKMKSEAARKILLKEYAHTVQNKSAYGLWHYFYNSKAPYFIPFETDTNSLLSYVAVELNEESVSKDLFHCQLTENAYYNLWFLPGISSLIYSPLAYFNILADRVKASNYNAVKNKVIGKFDAEFSVSCNVLLYLGENEKTAKTVDRLLQDVVKQGDIELMYYPYKTIAYYLFARSFFYGQLRAFAGAKAMLMSKLVKAVSDEEDVNTRSLKILAATAGLFFEEDGSCQTKLVDEAWQLFQEADEPFAFYCANLTSDLNPATGLPNAYFGSRALSVSFYLEFLNLLRYRSYRRFYGE